MTKQQKEPMRVAVQRGIDRLRTTGSNREMQECIAKPTDKEKLQYLRRMGYLRPPVKYALRPR
jgi:hypothetical protein